MAKDQKEKQRVLPLERKYMEDRKVDYKLYSFFQSISHLSINNERFVYKAEDPVLGKLTQENIILIFNQQCSEVSENLSLSTFKRRMNLYRSMGLIEEAVVEDRTGRKVKAYILRQDFEIFQYIPFDTLQYLANTASSSVIKIYVYLLNKFIWKQESGNYYSFTLGELAEVIGMSDNHNGNTRLIADCLNCLLANELINFVNYYETNLNGQPTPKMRLVKADVIYKLHKPINSNKITEKEILKLK